jgi:hypothetical protein
MKRSLAMIEPEQIELSRDIRIEDSPWKEVGNRYAPSGILQGFNGAGLITTKTDNNDNKIQDRTHRIYSSMFKSGNPGIPG